MATTDDWAKLETAAQAWGSLRCLLDLRARVEALAQRAAKQGRLNNAAQIAGLDATIEAGTGRIRPRSRPCATNLTRCRSTARSASL